MNEADALVLAHLLRTDRDRHRAMYADSERSPRWACWPAPQDPVRVAVAQAARLRSLLREFFPAALVAHRPTVTVLRRSALSEPEASRA